MKGFGSDLRLNLHFHWLVLDGVFVLEADRARRFVPVAAPTPDEMEALLTKIARRVRRPLRRARGASPADRPRLTFPASVRREAPQIQRRTDFVGPVRSVSVRRERSPWSGSARLRQWWKGAATARAADCGSSSCKRSPTGPA